MVTSQGIHLVFDRSFLKGDTALMVPKTSDGRVLFVIPWHGHAVAGTTDTPVDEATLEPRPFAEEIEFVLDTASRFLVRPPTRADVLAVFVGLRPLVRASGGGEAKTSALSRDHVIHVDTSGLLTITGGKWTTYRAMAEDCVDHAITLGKLPDVECATKNLQP
jgi:glycerol-3-phosphate dehydrogenase